MKQKTILELLEKCEALDQMLGTAHEEAVTIQKLAATENLDVMHIANAREIVAMRIGYLTRQKEAAEEQAAAEKAAAEKKSSAAAPKEEPPK
jgi:hypothetical protein